MYGCDESQQQQQQANSAILGRCACAAALLWVHWHDVSTSFTGMLHEAGWAALDVCGEPQQQQQQQANLASFERCTCKASSACGCIGMTSAPGPAAQGCCMKRSFGPDQAAGCSNRLRHAQAEAI
jgi:hypothetical protein